MIATVAAGGVAILVAITVDPHAWATALDPGRGRLYESALAGARLLVVLLLLSDSTRFINLRLVIDLSASVGFGQTGNPLATATLGGTIAILAALYHTGRRSPMLAVVRIAAISLGLSIAFLSGSRGQLLGAILMIIICYPLSRKLANPKQFLALVGK